MPWGSRMDRRVMGAGRETGTFQVDKQGGDVRRVDAADPPGLAERTRADPGELLAGLGAELGDGGEVEVGRQRLVLQPAEPLDLLRLAVDVAAVLGLDRHLLDGPRIVTGPGQR